MLDGLLGRNFSAKCKASIKVIRTRIGVIRRKRSATQKFLKKDVADLLANGLDINAYGRAEGLIAELTISSCYDFIEQSCECVLKHLSVMQKQSQCPEECRTAVGSLMFAAARFSDLPELRDLRHIFQERYDNALEHFVNQQFAENLASKPSSMEKKIQLMQSIASEFLIKWDSRAFERTMTKPPVAALDPPKKYGPFRVNEDSHKSPIGNYTVPKFDASPTRSNEAKSNGLRSLTKEDSVSKTEDARHPFNGHKSHTREDNVVKTDDLVHPLNGHRSHHKVDSVSKRDDPGHLHNKEGSVSKRDDPGHPLFRRYDGNGYTLPKEKNENTPNRDAHEIHFQVRHEKVITGKHETLSLKNEDITAKTHRAENSSHVKSDRRNIPFTSKTSHAGKIVSRDIEILNVREDTTPKIHIGSTSHGKTLEPPIDSEYKLYNRRRDDAAVKRDIFDTISPPKQEPLLQIAPRIVKEDVINIPIHIPPPYVKQPRSSKQGVKLENSEANFEDNVPNGFSKDPSIPNRTIDSDLSEKARLEFDHPRDLLPLPKPRSVRRRHSKPSSSSSNHANIIIPEERKFVKRVSNGKRRGDPRQGLQILIEDDEEEKMMDKLLLHYSKKSSTFDPEKLKRKSRARSESEQNDDEGSDIVRSVSLPREHSGPSEPTKVFTRAATFQPERSNPAQQHVHPKLPDYDDLAARFAALKGR